MFTRTKAKLNTVVNDRVTQPVTAGIIISTAAFILAGIALILVVRNAD